MTFGNTAKLNINRIFPVVTDWKQTGYVLLSADKGIAGLTPDNISTSTINPLLVDSAKDYAGVYLLNPNKLVYGLKWNATDGSAHGEFALRDGATLTLHTVLADNTGTTHTSGWDGKSLTKSGGGELILATQNTYTGTTTINGGTLKTATDDAIAGTSGVNIAENGTLNLNGHNQTLTDIDNSGTVLINDTGAAPLTTPVTVTGNMTLRQSGLVVINNGNSNAGQTLKVEGDWKGEGGTVSLGVVLGDDNSKADQLDISGHATGTTNVLIANENGSGAQTLEGIKLISTGSSDNNAFVQQGRIVAGSYDYHLQQ
ncbi:autotransporter outer membrane beta-barrel domain-containing protein, partial [Escherichia coli]|uniref:autotransporter outer membrane beta-barrel domain-containing protein n=2 Tax=Escherichia coli TaxID=562 RepID=UPI003D9B4962